MRVILPETNLFEVGFYICRFIHECLNLRHYSWRCGDMAVVFLGQWQSAYVKIIIQ